MTEVPYSRVDSQEFTVEGRVTGLGWEELAAEESDGGGASGCHLLQGCANRNVAGVCGEA